jgi:hypothetical protein
VVSLGCISVLRLKSVNQRILKILNGQYISISSLTLDLLTSKSIGVIGSLGCTNVYQVWYPSSKRFSRYWVDQWSLTLKSTGFIYSLGHTSVLSLKSVKERDLKILSRQYNPIPVLIDLDLWSIDLKINMGLSLLINNLHMKYHNNSHDIGRTPCGLPTDRCKTTCSSLSKGGGDN